MDNVISFLLLFSITSLSFRIFYIEFSLCKKNILGRINKYKLLISFSLTMFSDIYTIFLYIFYLLSPCFISLLLQFYISYLYYVIFFIFIQDAQQIRLILRSLKQILHGRSSVKTRWQRGSPETVSKKLLLRSYYLKTRGPWFTKFLLRPPINLLFFCLCHAVDSAATPKLSYL